jgi:hypothetical protein
MKKGMVVFTLTAELDEITEKVEKEDLLEAFMGILEAFGVEVTGEVTVVSVDTEEVPDGKE